MLKVWVGLEARSFLQASIETVCTLSSLLIDVPNKIRWNDASSTISWRLIYKATTTQWFANHALVHITRIDTEFSQPAKKQGLFSTSYSRVVSSSGIDVWCMRRGAIFATSLLSYRCVFD